MVRVAPFFDSRCTTFSLTTVMHSTVKKINASCTIFCTGHCNLGFHHLECLRIFILNFEAIVNVIKQFLSFTVLNSTGGSNDLFQIGHRHSALGGGVLRQCAVENDIYI